MTDTIYSGLFKIHIPKKTVENILDKMKEKRDFTKTKEIPKEIYLIYCNCSDRSLEDSPCDGYISEIYPDVIFVDPESRKTTSNVIAHELIHILQNYKYVTFKDDFEDSYRERWFEEMAFSLQDEIEKILKGKIKYEKVSDNHDEIEDFLISIMKDDFPDFFFDDEE